MDGEVQQSAALEKTATETDSLEQGTNIKVDQQVQFKHIRQLQKQMCKLVQGISAKVYLY